MDAEALEKILRSKNPTIEQERAAEAGGRWQEYMRERVRPPSWLRFGRRRAWQTAYDRALALGNSREVQQALIVELWFCENPDDDASRTWTRLVVASFGDGDYHQVEKARLSDRIVLARVELARRSCILPSRYYAPNMVLPYRNEHYAAVQNRTIERVLSVERVVDAPAAAKPTREVPPFSTDVEPGVLLNGIEPELAQTIRQLAAKLRIFPKPDPE